MGCSKSCSKWKVYGNMQLPQETRKTSNNLTLYLKQLEKEGKAKEKDTKEERSALYSKILKAHINLIDPDYNKLWGENLR